MTLRRLQLLGVCQQSAVSPSWAHLGWTRAGCSGGSSLPLRGLLPAAGLEVCPPADRALVILPNWAAQPETAVQYAHAMQNMAWWMQLTARLSA